MVTDAGELLLLIIIMMSRSKEERAKGEIDREMRFLYRRASSFYDPPYDDATLIN